MHVHPEVAAALSERAVGTDGYGLVLANPIAADVALVLANARLAAEVAAEYLSA